MILEGPDAVIHQSVSEVAQAADTSTATVVRCAQKLGYRGFHDLKLALAREQEPLADPCVRAGTSLLYQVCEAGAQTIRDAAALVDPVEFDIVVDAIAGAGRALFVGVGTSSPLAQDAAYRFTTIGVPAEAPADAHVQHVKASLVSSGDVCVAVSHTGSTREILTTVNAARAAGATTVAITSFARSPLTESVDHVILAGTRELSFGLEAMASRLAHLALLDALLVAVANLDPDRAQRTLRLYTDALGEHRF